MQIYRTTHITAAQLALAAVCGAAVWMSYSEAAAQSRLQAREPVFDEQEHWWVAKLEHALTLRSNRPRPKQAVTAVEPFSLDRLEPLEYLCTHAWSGIIAAAVYVPLWEGLVHMPDVARFHKRPLKEVLAYFSELHERLQTETGGGGGAGDNASAGSDGDDDGGGGGLGHRNDGSVGGHAGGSGGDGEMPAAAAAAAARRIRRTGARKVMSAPSGSKKRKTPAAVHPSNDGGGDSSSRQQCVLDMAVYVERLPGPKPSSNWYLFPVNSMRNLALELAQTEVVVLLDADFIVGPPSFVATLQSSPDAYASLLGLLSNRTLAVLPAFRNDASGYRGHSARPNNRIKAGDEAKAALKAIMGDTGPRAALLREWDAGEVWPFYLPHHGDTQYDVWRRAEKPFPIRYGEIGAVDGLPVYEPYVMALREQLPKYDERFRGYFKNKISYLWYLDALGFNFATHPGAFVMHYPHVVHRRKITKQSQSAKHAKLVQIFREELPRAFADGTYAPVVRPKL